LRWFWQNWRYLLSLERKGIPMTTAKSLTSVLLLVTTILAFGAPVWGQANVDESQETVTLYVDSDHGLDSNPGTQQLPLKTIGAAAGKAVANNQAGVGTKVIINPGTYRETVALMGSKKDTSLPMTFEAAKSGRAIMNGADVWTGWTVLAGNPNVYTHSWPNRWGLCPLDNGSDSPPPEEDIVRRREMILVNGAAITQVTTLSAMREGTFYVDESKGIAYLWPRAGTDMNNATVEVGTRSSLFSIWSKSNIVLRGLTFQYANSCRNNPAASALSSANILFDHDFFLRNNSVGLGLTLTTNTTVQNSAANFNGTSGMNAYETKYDLWQDSQTRYNGWRGAQGVYYDWGVAGMHSVKAHHQTIKNIESSFNQTFGFHWDTDHENVTADSLIASENLLGGGFIEKNEGPMTVSNSYFCNGSPDTGTNNLAFELRHSTYITFTGNTFVNTRGGFLVIGQPGGTPVTNWETGEQYNLITSYTTFKNNIVTGGSGQQLFTDGKLGGADWTQFQTTLTSDYNTWWNSMDPNVFLVPVPSLWTSVDFAGWKEASLQDVHSGWTPPQVDSSCKVAPLTGKKADFWFIMDAFSGYQTITAGNTTIWTPQVVAFGFTGTVKLSSDGVQNIPGATASWSTDTIVDSGSSTFTLTTSGSTPAGTYPITLIANNSGKTRTATVSVIVQ
jgi:hypothetical protein